MATDPLDDPAPLVLVSHGPPDGVDERYVNRELSWLDFNARVLALAEDESIPLLERTKFVAIFSQNLDEFFQVRVAGLKDQVAAKLSKASPDGRSPARQLLDIRDEVDTWTSRAQWVFLEQLVPALRDVGIVFSGMADLDEDDEKYLDSTFEDRIFPVLTPLAVDPGHPFPYISDLSLNLAVTLLDPATEERRFARVKVPILPRFVVMPDGERFVPLEQVISAHIDRLFPGMEITGHFPFRVTRNADLTLEEEEADDLLEAVEMEVRRRRFGRAVRLEVDTTMSIEVRELLIRELDLADEDVFEYAGPLDLGGLWSVHALDRGDLKDPAWKPVTPARFGGGDEKVDVFAELRKGDLLVHHPYEAFATTTEEFIRQASVDPRVLAIKTTIYRTSGDSPIVRSLIRAAERGKQVAVLVELKARFDEVANIEWAKELEKAGVHVTYGIAGLKIHTKTTLVVRDEPEGIRRYCHIGTGNYNPKTAKLYEDLGLLSADPVLGADLTQLFNLLTGYGRDMRYERLLVAPHHLRSELERLIRQEIEAGPGVGRLIFKMNSLIDAPMIDLLYEASSAGIEIDIIVRGICGLRPGLEGVSENIRVRSIIGRYLEHSRIYHFANGRGEGKPAYYIGSADLMPRNLDRRIEALTPIIDPALQAQLRHILDVNLADDQLAWTLDADNAWHRVSGTEGIDTHLRLQELELKRLSFLTESIERESKFSAARDLVLPDLTDAVPGLVASAPREEVLDASYFDASDLRLIHRGITVRHRSSSDRAEWTVKFPDEGPVSGDVPSAMRRRELNFDLPGGVIPDQVLDVVRADLAGASLVAVARLSTRRRSLDLRVGEEVVGEVDDDEVSVLRGDLEVARFREIEVEVRIPDPDGAEVLGAVGERLLAAGAGAADPTPKLSQALALLLGHEEPESIP